MGPRHTFADSLDPERAAPLKESLRTVNTAAVEFLTPIVETHMDSIDLHKLRNNPRTPPTAAAEGNATRPLRSAVRQIITQEENLRRAQVLARKINLLLDSRADESGQPYDYSAIEAGAIRVGAFISRTRWSMLKNGQVQVVPDECLRAIAEVFDVDSEYLLHENAELPAEVEAMLPQLRLKRLSEVRAFADRALGPVDPEGLRAITEILDQATRP